MNTLRYCLIITFIFLFNLNTNAGSDVDNSGPVPTPPADVLPASTFTESDCDKKIAALKKAHETELEQLNNQIKELQAALDQAKSQSSSLDSSLAALESEIASLKEQLEAANAEAEALKNVEEPDSTNWLPWIIALILAIIGFVLGRSTAGNKDSGDQS